MANLDFAQGEEASRKSFDKDIMFERRDSTSTTGSGLPVPLGHYTQTISGNCPRCRHHHRSIKIHFRNVNNSSRLVDVHCEKCNKLWLGSGSRNSTRVSLASNLTIDPPPNEPAIRTTLAHMVRSATQVAALQNLPNIQEGVSIGTFTEPSIRSPDRSYSGVASVRVVDHMPSMTSPTLPGPSIVKPACSPLDRVVKTETNDITAHPPRFVLRLKRRFGTTLLGRLIKLRNEQKTEPADRPEQVTQRPTPTAQHSALDTQAQNQGGQDQAALDGMAEKMDVCSSIAVATEGFNSLMVVDQEVINTMSPEQRIAFLRSQITAFSAQHNARSDAMLALCGWVNPEDSLDTLTTSAAIHNSLLDGTGNHFGEYNYLDVVRQSDSAYLRQSLNISETRISEAATIVEGRVYAPPGLVQEALHRGIWLSGQAHPLSTQGIVQSWDQIRRDRGDIRSSFDSSATIGAQSAASARDRLSYRRSRQRTSTLYNTEASVSQSRLQALRHLSDEYQQGFQRPASLPPPPPPPPSPPNGPRRPSA